MIQQVMTQPGVIEYREVPVPEIGPDDVLVKIEKIGICGSDIHVYHGKHPFTKYPVTQGHETSGVVEKVGANVEKVKPGQKVTIEPQEVCGECYPCRHGKYNLCEKLKVMGFQCTGVGSEFFACSQSKITPLPENMTLDQGAMIEPLAVAVHAVRQAGGGIEGKDVVVIGAGPIGNLVAQTAKGLGARKVMMTDVSEYRLNLAKEQCGVDAVYNTRERDFNECMIDCFGEDKADIIYDCAGNNITINQAIHSARKGSQILLVAVFADMAQCDLAVLNDHELDLNTTMMYRHEHYVTAIELVASGKVKLEPLMSKWFPFKKWLDGYKFIDSNRETTMKVIVNVQE